jgi:hypothetical protein
MLQALGMLQALLVARYQSFRSVESGGACKNVTAGLILNCMACAGGPLQQK